MLPSAGALSPLVLPWTVRHPLLRVSPPESVLLVPRLPLPPAVAAPVPVEPAKRAVQAACVQGPLQPLPGLPRPGPRARFPQALGGAARPSELRWLALPPRARSPP